LLFAARRSRKKTGIPSGEIFYQDLVGQPFQAKVLRSSHWGISGKPDCLIRTPDGVVPVELKKQKALLGRVIAIDIRLRPSSYAWTHLFDRCLLRAGYLSLFPCREWRLSPCLPVLRAGLRSLEAAASRGPISFCPHNNRGCVNIDHITVAVSYWSFNLTRPWSTATISDEF
jgi:hypothetical protein